MKISSDGLEFIKQAEGCKLHAYQDSVGVWTIGVGHTKGVVEGQIITQGMSDAFLEDDLQDVYPCIEAHVHVPLSQGQFDSVCSWIFNLGCGAFKGSTFLNKINKQEWSEAAAQILRWDHAGDKKLAGLTKRRQGESKMFLDSSDVA